MVIFFSKARIRAHYDQVTLDALSTSEEALPAAISNCPLKFDLVTPTRAHAAEAHRWSDLNWEENFAQWVADPKGVGCAIVVGDKLCGLAIGIAKKGSVNLTLMEGNPDPSHPFKGHVLDTMELFGFAVCDIVGARELRLVNPLDGALSHYLKSGFTLVEGPPKYCLKER